MYKVINNIDKTVDNNDEKHCQLPPEESVNCLVIKNLSFSIIKVKDAF